MFLKSVELYGFKSFADRTRFEFSEGITSLLGPNGSGKSNVVDSIKWVLATQALSSIRAGKREDVIFNGTDTRKPMSFCEVTLTLDNSAHLIDVDATEVAIRRYMTRAGENEYYVNGERVLQRRIKELFLDTGVGKAAYSILEQGKIDQILSLKPEDRRYIFEEAAGISKFKQQGDEAKRKLEKTDEQLAQADIMLKEKEKTYNSRKTQVERLRRYRELNAECERLEVEQKLAAVQTFTRFKDMKKQALEALRQEQAEVDAVLEQYKSALESVRAEVESIRMQRENLRMDILRGDETVNGYGRELQTLDERREDALRSLREAEMNAEEAQSRLARDRQNYEIKQQQLDSYIVSAQQTQLKIEAETEEVEKLRADNIRRRLDSENLAKENQRLEEARVGITQEISQMANSIADSLAKSISGSGYSTAVRSKAEKAFFTQVSRAASVLKERSDFLYQLAGAEFDSSVFRQAIEDATDSVRAEIDEIKGVFQEYSGTVPTFIDEFLSPDGVLTQKSNLDAALEANYAKSASNRELMASISDEMERVEGEILLKNGDIAELTEEATSLRTRISITRTQLSEIKDTLNQMELDFSNAELNIEAQKGRVAAVEDKIESVKQKREDLLDSLDAMRDQLEELNALFEERNGSISSTNSEYGSKVERKQQLIGEIAREEANISGIDEQIRMVYTEFFDDTGKSLREFDNHEVTADADQLKASLVLAKSKRDNLGSINYAAEDEFEEVRRDYEFLSKNMEDIQKAKADLEEVIAEIRMKSEELFIQTYDQISANFEEMFKILFGGGHAQLTLTDEENVLESGIEILAQPPGKKLTHLPLLSGGEKSMTAVALLFATYKVKPSPFCILDEIDAALDVRNIGAFMSVLNQFGEKSQFIIITHNKHTVMGSDSLLGVTQQELGVSKMVCYRLEDIQDDTGRHKELK